MEARLKAILEMESSQMQKELVAASNNLKKFERELAKATDVNHIQYLQRSIGVLNADINRLTAAANGSAKAMGAVGAATKSAGMNSQNFARVIQDLPFGFMGIQNNLTQLIPGVGAAGLAFSALTAAITFSQVGLQYWIKETKAAKASVSDLAEYTKEFTKNAAEETVNARLLYQAANNVNIAMDARLRAAKALKDMYPEILGNYSAEDIALGKAKKGYDDLTASILQNAQAQAAKNRVTSIEETIQNRLNNIRKINAITAKESAAITTPVKRREVGGEGKALLQITERTVTVEEQRAVVQERRNKAIQKELDLIKQLRAEQGFFTNLAGGATNLQNSVIPPPEKVKTYATPAQKDSSLAAMIAMNADWQQKKGKNWWRNTQTERGNNLGLQDTTKVRIEENRTLNKILAEQADVQAMLNEQLAGAASIAEYGGQVFGQMVAAMMNGQSIGDVLANAFKQIAVQIAAAVAQALIFAALLEAFPALKGVFGAVGAISGNMGQTNTIGNLVGQIQGQNIQLSMNRTSTGMGFRRGRR